jgi:hypothetical protein
VQIGCGMGVAVVGRGVGAAVVVVVVKAAKVCSTNQAIIILQSL